MQIGETALAIVRQLLLFGAILTPLELLLPVRGGRPLRQLLRPGALTDLLYFTLNPFLINVGTALLLYAMGGVIRWAVPVGALTALGAQPLPVQLAEIFLGSELAGYWVHRLSHRTALLWRFHAVHHSNQHLDWLAAHRQHPLEAIWLLGVANLPVLLLGFPIDSILWVVLLQKLYTAFLHANVRLGFGRFSLVLASPQFHHWHHDGEGGPDVGNFSSLLPILDWLWGSYRLPAEPGRFPRRYGIDEPMAPDYARQLAHPLRPGQGAGSGDRGRPPWGATG